MSINSNLPNAAKETGGNLDATAQLLLYMQQLVHIARENKAILKAINVQLGTMNDTPLDPATFMDEITTFN